MPLDSPLNGLTIATIAKRALPNIDLTTIQSRAIEGLDVPFQLAYEEPLLSYSDLSRSFIEHIKKIVVPKNQKKYFASYTFLGQSSSVGKSRLLQSPLISGGTALFILYINCKKYGMTGIPKFNAISQEIAQKFMKCTEEKEMTPLLMKLLYATFQAVLKKEKNQYFLNRPFGSYEPQDLQLDLARIMDFKSELDHEDIWALLKEMTSNIKYRMDVNGKLREIKIIPIVALDEAACFIENVFDFKGSKKTMNSFRLMRRSLRAKGGSIWSCPFIFAGTNTRFGNFVPSKSSDSSARMDLPDKMDAANVALHLFDPYVLKSTWDVYAKARNYSGDAISDWRQYIISKDYLYHLCNYGRPIWGAVVQASLKGHHEKLSRGPFKFPHLPEDFKMIDLWEELQKFANEKIGYIDKNGTEDDHVESSIAIISLTTGIGFYHSSLVTSLVERRMAFLLDYRYDNGQLLVTYPVEPVLSNAAIDSFQNNALSIVRNLMSAKVFSQENIGEIGELVIRIMFLLCVPPINEICALLLCEGFFR